MELNGSTFILEIINFLVLVWILKRFLYKPVLEVIEQRRAAIQKEREETARLQADAEQRQQQFQNRLDDWNRERQQLREKLMQELENERSVKLQALRDELQTMREKQQTAEDSRLAELRLRVETTAQQQAAQFASRLLRLGAGQDTEARLLTLLVDELDQLPAQRRAALANNHEPTPDVIEVQSAYPLSAGQRSQLEKVLSKLTTRSLPVHYHEDPELIAGLNIVLGAWVLAANLRDELKGLADMAQPA